MYNFADLEKKTKKPFQYIFNIESLNKNEDFEWFFIIPM